MAKRWLVLALGLGLLLTANLRPCYRVSVADETLPGRYSLRQTEECAQAARSAAEEILENSVTLPTMQRSLRLIGPIDGDCAALTDALLRSTRGVGVSTEVLVNGTRLGTVADGDYLCAALRSFILNQMPHAAVSGNISGRLELRQVYTRAGQDRSYPDMVLLITGMAPVIYVDAEGKLA